MQHGRWINYPRENIIDGMKRILLAAALLSSSLLFGAEIASWHIVTEPGYMTRSGTFFSPSSLEAASSSYPMGSVLELVSTETGRSTVVTVTDTLPELPEGRTIAVTGRTLRELGLMDKGVGEVKERTLRVGTIENESAEETGWYMFELGAYADSRECNEAYRSLAENGLRPYIDNEDGLLYLSVRHVMAFELEDAAAAIRDAGITPGPAIMEPNPYI